MSMRAIGLVLTVVIADVFGNNKILTEWVISDTLSRKCNINIRMLMFYFISSCTVVVVI